MAHEFWHKQTVDQPLFPDLLWSRPENKQQAGKLLIIGGSAHGFVAPADAYTECLKAGVGSVRVLLPQQVQKLLPGVAPEMEFLPDTPSGSFSQQALAEVLDATSWADGILIAGDLGRNSETAILLEQLVAKHSGQLTVVQDALDYFIKMQSALLMRPNTLIVPSFAQLQKLASAVGFTTAFTSTMDFLHLVDALREFTSKYQVYVVLEHVNTTFVAVSGQVSTTKPAMQGKEVKHAAHAAVWWLQNSSKPFEAITTSVSESYGAAGRT